jgi:hypothetical protein
MMRHLQTEPATQSEIHMSDVSANLAGLEL